MGNATWWRPAYIGIGSNLADPEMQVRRAFEALGNLPLTRLVLTSSLYRSEPLGTIEQPEFVNAVAGLITQLAAQDLLTKLQDYERLCGRDRQSAQRWGPRIIDLDILMYSSDRLSSDTLTLPHPGIIERNFVLLPLAEIAPDLQIQGLGLVAKLAENTAKTGLHILDTMSAGETMETNDGA